MRDVPPPGARPLHPRPVTDGDPEASRAEPAEADPIASVDTVHHALAGARPDVDPLDRALTRSRAAGALFGRDAGQPRIGRHIILERAGAGGMGVVWEAYDPELDRAVAIKLVRADSARARERVLAEGQALARLSHPNVVPVFDVGLYDEQVYLVMELVRGETLRAHVAGARRDARAIAQIYRQAGEGLAAAHRAGLVHRDFKPDNAIVGRDGRVRILDFGLAVEPDPTAGEEPAAVAGTPRYMAPEQAAGQPVTAAADQYAFCASLREALTAPSGEVPARPAPPPRWLEAIVARGTQADPAARFPSMDEVTRALGRDPRVILRNRLLALGAAALCAGAFAVGRAASEGEGALVTCDGGRPAIDAVWGGGRRSAMLDHLTGEDDPYARASAPRIARDLDRYRDRWAAGHADACLAHRRGEQSAALLDRRMACLARGKAALSATVDVLTTAPASAIPGAVIAVGELPDLDRCGDPAAMLAAIAPPPPAAAGRVAALDADLERALVLLRADRLDEARHLTVAAVTTARELHHPPILARALLVLGRIEMDSSTRSNALAALGEATTLALEAADDALAVEAFARRAWVDGTQDQPDFGRALDGLGVIEALAARLGPAGSFARALLENNVAGVEQARGRPYVARARLERAVVESRQVSGPGAVEVAKFPAHLAIVLDDATRRDALLDESIARLGSEIGADHPATLLIRALAGKLTANPARAVERLEPACRAYSSLHAARGEPVANCWFELGWLAAERGDDAALVEAMGEVDRTASTGGPPVKVGMARAYLALARGDPADARRGFVEARRQLGPLAGLPWWVRWFAVETQLGEAAALRAVDRPREAESLLERARSEAEAIVAAHPAVQFARRLAWIRLELVRLRAARAAPAEATAELARAAAAWYREAGGYGDAVAELDRLTGSR